MNVGEYVRTKDGALGKIIDKYKVNDYYKIKVDIRNGWIEKHREDLFKKHIIKSSPQIIDLIEENDYVNGNKIIKTSQDYCGRTILIYGYDDGERQVAITIYEDDIKTIVTHEQMEAMQYRVEE